MNIKFENKLFNPLYFHLCKFMNDSNIRTILFYGSSSAAKSYSAMQAISIETLAKAQNTLAMRKVSADLKDSIFADFKGFNYKLSHVIPNTYEIIINEIRINENRIRFKGIDNPERIKGIAEFTKIYLDELTEFNFVDYSQMQKRLRGRKNQQILASWNPISDKHWIKKELIDKQVWNELPKNVEGVKYSELSEDSFIKINKAGDTILIKTTYKDNFWIVGHPKYKDVGFYDKHQINHLEGLKHTNPNDYKIYAKGEWGVPSEGLIFQYTGDFITLRSNLKVNEVLPNKVYWSKYRELPAYDLWKGFGLDFGGGGNILDEVDGKSKNVLLEVNISKVAMEIYVKLHVYKGYIDTEGLCVELDQTSGKRYEILADNARADKITELQNKGYMVIPAKTKEGKSTSVTSGYDILKNYKIFSHELDLPVHTEWKEHKWKINNITKEVLDVPEDKFKDIADALRYIVTYYHLNYNV